MDSPSGVPKLFPLEGQKLKLHGGPSAKRKHIFYCILKMQNYTVWKPWLAGRNKDKWPCEEKKDLGTPGLNEVYNGLSD